MNADDLRRLSQEATERAKREADDAQKAAAESQRKLAQDRYEGEWKRAREIVAALETTVRAAASQGEHKCDVYYFHSSKECPVTVTCVQRFFSYDQLTKGCKDHRYSYRLP